jgi:hypothetical protein
VPPSPRAEFAVRAGPRLVLVQGVHTHFASLHPLCPKRPGTGDRFCDASGATPVGGRSDPAERRNDACVRRESRDTGVVGVGAASPRNVFRTAPPTSSIVHQRTWLGREVTREMSVSACRPGRSALHAGACLDDAPLGGVPPGPTGGWGPGGTTAEPVPTPGSHRHRCSAVPEASGPDLGRTLDGRPSRSCATRPPGADDGNRTRVASLED